MRKKESQVQKEIMMWLKANRFWHTRVNSGSITKTVQRNGRVYNNRIRLAEEGTPDILACIHGRFVGIEVKRDQEEVDKWNKIADDFEYSPYVAKSYRREVMQYRQSVEIKRCGGFHFVVGGYQNLAEMLHEYGIIEKEEMP